MFTIKHIHNNGETLFEGREPMYFAPSPNERTPEIEARVAYTNEHGVIITIEGGSVYVMNDLGKTVAHYNLDGVPRAA